MANSAKIKKIVKSKQVNSTRDSTKCLRLSRSLPALILIPLDNEIYLICLHFLFLQVEVNRILGGILTHNTVTTVKTQIQALALVTSLFLESFA